LEFCKCREVAPVSCPEQPEQCPTTCTFGYAYDSNGCKTCTCLSNGCEGYSCANYGEVCAFYVHPLCPMCPVTLKCVDGPEVKRVHVSLTYNHQPVKKIDLTEFKRQVVLSVMKFLSIKTSDIVGSHAHEITNQSVHASFHLISVGHLVQTYNALAIKIKAGVLGNALIMVNGITFIPQGDTIVGVYYTSVEDWDGEDLMEAGSFEALIIAVAVGVGVFLVVITITIIILTCKKKQLKKEKKTNNQIYRPVPTTRTA